MKANKFKKSPLLLKEIRETVGDAFSSLWITSFSRELQDQVVIELFDSEISVRVNGDDDNLSQASFGELLDRFCEVAEASGKCEDSDRWILETCASLRREIDRVEARVKKR